MTCSSESRKQLGCFGTFRAPPSHGIANLAEWDAPMERLFVEGRDNDDDRENKLGTTTVCGD